MAQDDKIYYARRAAEEMERAQSASDPVVAKTHRGLLKEYLERASVGDRPRFEPPVIG